MTTPSERGRDLQTNQPGAPEAGRPRFPLGALYATPGAIRECDRAKVTPIDYIQRHQIGDWGDLDADDKRANEDALARGSRMFSAYNLPTDARLWVITEADRSVTTALLPEEY